jgi:hypothetical protein
VKIRHDGVLGTCVRLLMAAGLCWSLTAGGIAAADDYPLTTGSLSSSVDGESTATFASGATVTVAGGGFAPGAMVTITLHSTPVMLARVTASASGRIQEDVHIPVGTDPGEHTIKAEGAAPSGGTTLLSQPVTVQGTASGATVDTPAFTHSDVAAVGSIAAGAVAAGAVAFLAVRRARARA